MPDQARFDVRCEWGQHGVELLAPEADSVVIVDVLSFCTCVDVATARGVIVYPCRWRDPSAAAFAARLSAHLAGSRAAGGLSLSPGSLLGLAPGSRLVLPSPNGSALSVATGRAPTFAGCLRNAAAVARAARRLGSRVAVIPAGERWPDGGIRASLEDWLGAGAVIAHLAGSKSPEARAAEASFRGAEDDLDAALRQSVSGREMMAQGYAEDVTAAAQSLVSDCVPRLVAGAYVNVAAPGAGDRAG
jgi:2-phosphosulfolactate phosphatase